LHSLIAAECGGVAGGQEILIDYCMAAPQQHGMQQQMWAVPGLRLT